MHRFILLLAICQLTALPVLSQKVAIEDYGAKANGKANCTQAIQSAIDEVHKSGGGTIVFSQGTYLAGSIFLKSNITLVIEKGATLKAIPDTSQFIAEQSSIISRMDVTPWKAFIRADTEENITITGGGTIDGSGNEPCFTDGIENSPARPYGLFFINCKNIVLRDLNLRSSAFWMQRYLNCEGITLDHLDVYNHANKNNDGIDIDSSTDVLITNCRIDSSDDGICLKTEGEGTTKNVVISNCIIGTHASAIKTGTGSVGDFENISISNTVIKRSASKQMMHPLKAWGGLTGIDIITTDGGAIRNVNINNIIMEGVENPIHVRLGNRLSGNVAVQGYGGDGDARQGVKASDKSTRITEQFVMEDIMISQVSAKNVGPYPVIICGLPGYPIKRITLRDITIQSAQAGNKEAVEVAPNWDGTRYPGRGMYGTQLPAYGLLSNHTSDLVIENFRAIPASGEARKAIIQLNNESL